MRSLQTMLKGKDFETARSSMKIGTKQHVVIPAASAPNATTIADWLKCTPEYAARVRDRFSASYLSDDGNVICSRKIAASTVSGDGTMLVSIYSAAEKAALRYTFDDVDVAMRTGVFGKMSGAESYGDALLGSFAAAKSNTELGIGSTAWVPNVSGLIPSTPAVQKIAPPAHFKVPNLGDVIILLVILSDESVVGHILDSRLGPFITAKGQVVPRGYVFCNRNKVATGNFSYAMDICYLTTAESFDPLGVYSASSSTVETKANGVLFGALRSGLGHAGSSPCAVVDGRFVSLTDDRKIFGWPSDVGFIRRGNVSTFASAGASLKQGLRNLFLDQSKPVPTEIEEASLPGVYLLSVVDNPVNPPVDFMIGTEMEPHRSKSEVLNEVMFPEDEARETVQQVRDRIAKVGPKTLFMSGSGVQETGGLITCFVSASNVWWRMDGAVLGVSPEESAALASSELADFAVVDGPACRAVIDAAVTSGALVGGSIAAAREGVEAVLATKRVRGDGRLDIPYSGSGMDWARSYGTKASSEQIGTLYTAFIALTGAGVEV